MRVAFIRIMQLSRAVSLRSFRSLPAAGAAPARMPLLCLWRWPKRRSGNVLRCCGPLSRQWRPWGFPGGAPAGCRSAGSCKAPAAGLELAGGEEATLAAWGSCCWCRVGDRLPSRQPVAHSARLPGCASDHQSRFALSTRRASATAALVQACSTGSSQRLRSAWAWWA